MATPMALSRRAAVLIAAAVFACIGGCGKPSEESRQNRRLVDAVLTAVTTKNRKELDKDAALWDKRHADGLLSEKPHKAVKACIEKAKAGDWAGAEDELYKFRKSDPFPE